MRLLIATPIYPPEIGGPATYTRELCERLREKYEITVIAYTDVREPFRNTQLISISKRRPLPVRLVRFFLTALREAKNTDLIYVQNAMAAGLPVALVGLLTRKPFILKFVGDEAWERATQRKQTTKRLEEFLRSPEGGSRIRLMMMIQGWVLRKADLVTTPSAYLRDEIVKSYGVKPERAVVNYNAAEETETPPFKPRLIKHQVVTTARLVAWKGLDGIIRALEIVLRDFPDARLVVAGDGPEMEKLKKLARDLGLKKNVDFLGNISRAETWQLRKNSEIYVLNSTYEGLPHTILTNFAAEIPTVATDISGTNEAVYHEKTGLLVKPGDDEGLAAAIERLFINKKLCNEIVAEGKILLRDKFSWKSHLKNLEALFQSVLTQPNY